MLPFSCLHGPFYSFPFEIFLHHLLDFIPLDFRCRFIHAKAIPLVPFYNPFFPLSIPNWYRNRTKKLDAMHIQLSAIHLFSSLYGKQPAFKRRQDLPAASVPLPCLQQDACADQAAQAVPAVFQPDLSVVIGHCQPAGGQGPLAPFPFQPAAAFCGVQSQYAAPPPRGCTPAPRRT